MSKCSFIVNLTPEEVMNKVKDKENSDLVHEEARGLLCIPQIAPRPRKFPGISISILLE